MEESYKCSKYVCARSKNWKSLEKQLALKLIFSFLIVQTNGILLILEREHAFSRIRFLEYIWVRIEKAFSLNIFPVRKSYWEIRAPQYTKQTYMACNSIRYQLYGNYLEEYIRYVVFMGLYSYQHPLAMNAPNYWLRKAI